MVSAVVIMKGPQPLFDTLNEFQQLDFDVSGLGNERPVVREYLEGFPHICQAIEGYAAVRSFLHDHSECESTCSGQLIPDTVLSFSSAFAGASPSLN